MSGRATWYAGRLGRSRGGRAPVEVLAVSGPEGLKPITNAHKRFPKSGNVELIGPTALAAKPGEWLMFQVAPDPRPGIRQFHVGPHRLLHRFADLDSLKTVEGARVLFTRDGWAGATDAGHWAIRYSDDRLLALHLERHRDGRLRCSERSLPAVACRYFDKERLLLEPVPESDVQLYDHNDDAPVAVYDWSPGADYVAHVIRSLAGADDPRLPEVIAWLELHREERTGRISAIGTDHELAFEAIRSGELAARLSADRMVMQAYLSAVKDDPAVAAAVERATREEARATAEAAKSELADSLASERKAALAAIDQEARDRLVSLQAEVEARAAERAAELARELDASLTERREAIDAARAELAELEKERSAASNDLEALMRKAAAQEDRARIAAERASEAQRAVAATRASGVHRLVSTVVADTVGGKCIDRAELGGLIDECVLLTEQGKRLMARLVAYMLAGEIPILQGPAVADFSIVAAALVAGGRLVTFDADPTTITPEDVWSRPGSSFATQVAQAAALAADGSAQLVQLRHIDRSAARFWHPALSNLSRTGLLPRPLLLFATVSDGDSDEARAIDESACMKVEHVVVDIAPLFAPALLSGGPNAISTVLDAGPRALDLSTGMAALQILADEGVTLDIATSLRITRVALEAASLAPDVATAAIDAARGFCRDIGCIRVDQKR